MKIFISILTAIFLAMITGTGLASAIDVEPVFVVAPLIAASFLPLPTGVLSFALIKREAYVKALNEDFTHKDTFLDGIPDASKHVKKGQEADVINIIDILTQVEVLIDNTTYPLTPTEVADAKIPISLNKFETQPSVISRDAMYAVRYDVIKETLEMHKVSLVENTADYSAFNLAPDEDTAKTPIVKTSGENNGTGFKKLVIKDLISLKKAFDDAKIPQGSRRLVLCSQHVADLLEVSTTFEVMYGNMKNGVIGNLLGFEIREYINNPVYDASFEKRPYKATPVGTDRQASFAFYVKRMFKAKGQTIVDFTEADALNKKNYLGTETRFIARPIKQEAIGAIVNDNA